MPGYTMLFIQKVVERNHQQDDQQDDRRRPEMIQNSRTPIVPCGMDTPDE